MRQFLILSLMCFFFSTLGHAQYRQGDGELILLGTVGSVTTTTELTFADPSVPGSTSSSERLYLYVAATPAYYLINGLSAELELGLRTLKGVRPAQSAVLHLSYTQSRRRSIVAWFLRGGYGVANGLAVPVYDNISRLTDGFDVGIISLGAGLKIRPAGRGLIRIEANYRIQMYETGDALYTMDHTVSSLALLLGVGFVL
ncbi:MAG: hypothetical protein M5R41_14995 [Bacteroidia bacterium]|nr:hypothetical protein [Bacteroidia bacterium]